MITFLSQVVFGLGSVFLAMMALSVSTQNTISAAICSAGFAIAFAIITAFSKEKNPFGGKGPYD